MKRSLPLHDRILQAAREMRCSATPAEKALWAKLRKRRLVVEVDGYIYDYQKDEDAARTRQLEDYGYRMIRFRNEDILNVIERVLSQIAAAALSPVYRPAGDRSSTPHLISCPDSGRGEPPPPQILGEPACQLPGGWVAFAGRVVGGEGI